MKLVLSKTPKIGFLATSSNRRAFCARSFYLPISLFVANKYCIRSYRQMDQRRMHSFIFCKIYLIVLTSWKISVEKSSFQIKKIHYGKCSKISNTFLFLFSNKMLVFRAGIHKMLVIIANREDPDQTASPEAV